MAVKRRKFKKNKITEMIKNSVRVKCCYCDSYKTCIHKENKEKSEKMGIITHCTLAPKKTNKKGGNDNEKKFNRSFKKQNS